MQTSRLRYFLLSLFLVFYSALLPAQGASRLTIDELQQAGLKANGLVQAARSQVDMAEAGVVAARAYPNPNVAIKVGPQSKRIPASITGPANDYREVNVTQPIENPFFDLHVFIQQRRW